MWRAQQIGQSPLVVRGTQKQHRVFCRAVCNMEVGKSPFGGAESNRWGGHVRQIQLMGQNPKDELDSSSQQLMSSICVIPHHTTESTASLFGAPSHFRRSDRGSLLSVMDLLYQVTPCRTSLGLLGFCPLKTALSHPVSKKHFRLHSDGIYSIPSFIQSN